MNNDDSVVALEDFQLAIDAINAYTLAFNSVLRDLDEADVTDCFKPATVKHIKDVGRKIRILEARHGILDATGEMDS